MKSIKIILLNYLRGDLSGKEQEELRRWIERNEDNRLLFNRINDPRLMAEALEKMDQMDEEGVWRKIELERKLPTAGRWFSGWIRYAAMILLATGVGAYFFFFNRTDAPDNDFSSTAQYVLENDIQPGTDGAILTLSDGSKIVLDSAGNGVLFQEGSAKIIKQADGALVYKTEKGKAEEVLFNTLSTDRGKQFYVQLPDGTRAWLNSYSSLYYPMQFTGKERRVTVTGEAYFEVARNADMPFIVVANGQEILALGTSFNINAYHDEGAVKTTLASGSVKVSSAVSAVTLKPGQQSILSSNGNMQVQEADVSRVIAWKNGYFSFVNADIKQIMRQLSRWYDVDVVYEGETPKVQFSGEIGRSLTLGQLLDILNETRIRYRLENKRLIIMPG